MHVGPELDEEALHLCRNDVPQFKLTNARRIDDPAAEVELDQLRRRSSVPALLVDVADGADAQAEVGLDDVEERRFAHAALAGDDTLPILEDGAQAIDALAADGAGEQGL